MIENKVARPGADIYGLGRDGWREQGEDLGDLTVRREHRGDLLVPITGREWAECGDGGSRGIPVEQGANSKEQQEREQHPSNPDSPSAALIGVIQGGLQDYQLTCVLHSPIENHYSSKSCLSSSAT